MKKSSRNVSMVSMGIAVCSLFLLPFSSFAGGDKPEGKPWPCPEKNAKMESLLKSDEATLAAGKALWNQHCKSCHGKTGKGDGTKAESIEISCGDFTLASYFKKPVGELYWKTTEGRKPMPSFKLKLTDAERWSVILYSRTFDKKSEAVETSKK